MDIMRTAGEYINAFLDLIYPSKTICYMCGKMSGEYSKCNLCSDCYTGLPFIPDHHCIKCGTPLRMVEDGPACEQCKNTDYCFDRAISAVRYEKDIKELVYKLKYFGHTYLAVTIGCIMAYKLKQEHIKTDIIIPVPLYIDREKQRGFNQATLISKYISETTGIPLNTEILIRIKNTKAMYNMNRGERRKNVENAFRTVDKKAILDKDILLVDDIFTTGSTANACSRELIKDGAKTATVLTFAKD